MYLNSLKNDAYVQLTIYLTWNFLNEFGLELQIMHSFR
jgi:hypothetical protein